MQKQPADGIVGPSFDIVHCLAFEARVTDSANEGRRGATDLETTCPDLLPDQTRTRSQIIGSLSASERYIRLNLLRLV